MRRFRNIIALVPALLPSVRATAQATWRVDAKPVLDVSSSSPSGAVLFARVSGATRLGDGTIVIADGDDMALHFFDTAGRPLRSAGRAGSGPGEFRNLSWMGRCTGDSLHIWDMLQARMSVFAPNGAFARQYTIADSSRGAQPFMTLACSPNGALVYQGQPRPTARPVPHDPRAPTRQERIMPTAAAVSLATTTGVVLRSIGDRSAGALYLVGGGVFPLPLGTATYLAATANRIYVGTADSTATIEAFPAAGAPVTIRLTVAPRSVTAEAHNRAATAIASLAPAAMRTIAEDSLDAAPAPRTLPPYTALLADRSGVLWVQLSVPGDSSTRLRALSEAGVPLGDVTLPANVTVHEIGADYILGSYDDPGDIPHFALFRLHRGK